MPAGHVIRTGDKQSLAPSPANIVPVFIYFAISLANNVNCLIMKHSVTPGRILPIDHRPAAAPYDTGMRGAGRFKWDNRLALRRRWAGAYHGVEQASRPGAAHAGRAGGAAADHRDKNNPCVSRPKAVSTAEK